MIRGRAMYPEYLTDARILICPSSATAKEEYEAGRWWETNVIDRPGARPSISPCRIDDLSYHYVPWMFRTEWLMDSATMDFSRDFYVGFLDAVEKAGHSPRGATNWGFTDENGRDRKVHPLRQGIERTLITDIDAPWRGWRSDSSVPIAFDHVSTNSVYFNHVPGGANILYMDGHVEFATYPQIDLYPLTRAWAMLVANLDSEQMMASGRY
jgi:prepilin-type processing-associated H-X9-DG protein